MVIGAFGGVQPLCGRPFRAIGLRPIRPLVPGYCLRQYAGHRTIVSLSIGHHTGIFQRQMVVGCALESLKKYEFYYALSATMFFGKNALTLHFYARSFSSGRAHGLASVES